jgi:hypothetical protein
MTPPGPYFKNATVNYTITGTNFQPGNTIVMFRNKAGFELNATNTVNSGVWSVTPTGIYGTIVVNNSASSATPYNISVTTFDGGTGAKESAFSILQLPAPVLQSFTPATGFKNTSVSFMVNGLNFQTTDGYTNISFVNVYTGEKLYGAIASATSTKITGTLVVPAGTTGGVFDLMVTTVDGGTSTRAGALYLNSLPLPLISGINKTYGYRNTTVPFIITGTNFQPGGGTFVRLNSTAGAPIYAALSSVTSTSIHGTFTIPYDAGTGKYRLDVLTLTGGPATKLNAFTITPIPAPTIATITPVSGFRNSTVSYTINGLNLQPDGGTVVRLSHPVYGELDTMVYSVTSTQIIGNIQIPSSASYGTWKLNVSTIEGGLTSKPSAFSVKILPKPIIGTFSPSTAYRGTTVTFVINGNNFQPGGRTAVNLSKAGQAEIQTTQASVYSSQITGTVTLPAGDTTGPWKVNVTTLDGGVATKPNAILLL